MARRKVSSASSGKLGRFHLTNRSFDDSINQLTADSIEQSLLEIERIMQERYGRESKQRETKAPADTHVVR